MLCHFVFSKLLKYILLSADVSVAGRSERLFCHHVCLFERCCITYFPHWPTATLKIISTATSAQSSLLCLCSWQLVRVWLSPGSSPWRWLIVVKAAVWRMGGAEHTHTHRHAVCVWPLLEWKCLLGVVKPLVPWRLTAATLNWYQRPGRTSDSLALCSVVCGGSEVSDVWEKTACLGFCRGDEENKLIDF